MPGLLWYYTVVSVTSQDRPTCKEIVDGHPCGKPVKTLASGLCMTHYQRMRRRNLKLGTETGSTEVAEIVAPMPGSKYGVQRIEAALLAVVMKGGVVKQAAELTGIPAPTISKWVNAEYSQRYNELRAKHGPELEKLAVQGLLDFVRQAEEVKIKALERTAEELAANKSKDPAATLRNVATAQGISVTKIMELSGRPTSVVIHRSPAELMARLRARGAVVDVSSEEISDATLVPETTSDAKPGV